MIFGDPRVEISSGPGEREDISGLDPQCPSRSRAMGGDWPDNFLRLREDETHCHLAVWPDTWPCRRASVIRQ